jgi:hypothetical protein
MPSVVYILNLTERQLLGILAEPIKRTSIVICRSFCLLAAALILFATKSLHRG